MVSNFWSTAPAVSSLAPSFNCLTHGHMKYSGHHSNSNKAFFDKVTDAVFNAKISSTRKEHNELSTVHPNVNKTPNTNTRKKTLKRKFPLHPKKNAPAMENERRNAPQPSAKQQHRLLANLTEEQVEQQT